eukprot:TRINITY_DN8350_c0_g1_i1.p2 TRINITY_DN8350_c0_g1~~TRINITY_DN8350_c0_g1_i1.p2  ORF type:complete len:134 (+),score=42.33 TRINITY_DN8350_c0_g1_i1:84-485(+)
MSRLLSLFSSSSNAAAAAPEAAAADPVVQLQEKAESGKVLLQSAAEVLEATESSSKSNLGLTYRRKNLEKKIGELDYLLKETAASSTAKRTRKSVFQSSSSSERNLAQIQQDLEKVYAETEQAKQALERLTSE